MRNGRVIIDAVGHTVDLAADNRRDEVPLEAFNHFAAWLHRYGHAALESDSSSYQLPLEEFVGGWTTEELTHVFFVESDVDMVALHAVNFFDLFKRGANPWPQCLAIKRAAPDRVLLYAPCDPLADPAAERERMAQRAEEGADGFKFYPVNGLRDERGAPMSYSFADDLLLGYIDHARSLGVAHVAVHKAFPTSPGSNVQDRPDDVTVAAAAFPDVTFEVVHSGWAFLEDCALQLMLNPNIYANLETTANTAVRMPRRFLRAVGTLLAAAPDRVLFATGAPICHPQPIIEAIESLAMPEDLLDEGLPELTDSLKAGILGENFARMHALDVDEVRERLSGDDFAVRRDAHRADPHPWQLKRERVHATVPATPAT